MSSMQQTNRETVTLSLSFRNRSVPGEREKKPHSHEWLCHSFATSVGLARGTDIHVCVSGVYRDRLIGLLSVKSIIVSDGIVTGVPLVAN